MQVVFGGVEFCYRCVKVGLSGGERFRKPFRFCFHSIFSFQVFFAFFYHFYLPLSYSSISIDFLPF